MNNELRQELTGRGEVVWGDKIYKNIRYTVIIEKESPEDREPDIYGTVNDEDGDRLDISLFVGTREDVILNLEDGRYLKMVFLDESPEFEVDGDFREQ